MAARRLDGAAMVAASASETFVTSFPKNTRDASATP